MSLLGRKLLPIPDGASVTVEGQVVTVKGPQGTLTVSLHPDVRAAVEGKAVRVLPAAGRERAKGVSAQWGTAWALLRNALQGATAGFAKRLELQGVGYRAELVGNTLRLSVGFTHPVELPLPAGVALAVDKNIMTVSGVNRQQVGEFAAVIRRVRPPEPYKGKGIRYLGEVVRRKVGKVVGAAGAGAGA